MFISVWIFSR